MSHKSVMQQIDEQVQHRRLDRVLILVVLGLFLVGTIVAVLLAAAGSDRQQQIDVLQEQEAERQQAVDLLATDVVTLREQLQDEGVTPDAPPPEDRIDDLPDLIGPQGERGPQGPRGLLGPVGPMGEPGLPGGVGPAGPAGESIIGPQGESGPAGDPGESIVGPTGPAGADGQDGQDGTDSTVPGPQGPAGAAGQPPFSWTFQFPPGIEHTCTRTEPFDPAVPTYTCTS